MLASFVGFFCITVDLAMLEIEVVLLVDELVAVPEVEEILVRFTTLDELLEETEVVFRPVALVIVVLMFVKFVLIVVLLLLVVIDAVRFTDVLVATILTAG